MGSRARNASAVVLLFSTVAACGASRDDEEDAVARHAQALEAGAGACRDFTLEAWRRPGPGGAHDDVRTLTPPLRFTVPSEIAISDTKNHGAKKVLLGFDEQSCTYKAGGNRPPERALLESCVPPSVRAGDLVTASEVSLALLTGNQATARVRIVEAEPCGADASSDGGVPDGGGGTNDGGAPDGGGAIDAGQDAPACTPSTCEGSACVAATCTPSGCIRSNASDGTICATGSACSTGACLAGTCFETPIVLPPPPACNTVSCDPVLGIVTTPVADGALCDADQSACTEGDRCVAGACVSGNPRVCVPSGVCMRSACNAAAGCVETPVARGVACGPVDVCGGTARCDGNGVCTPGAPLDCSSPDPCLQTGCSPTTGCTAIPIPGCSPGGATEPFEPRASLMGRLVASSGAPITGATFTVSDAALPGGTTAVVRTDVSPEAAPDGSFRLRLLSFASTENETSPPVHVVLRVDAPNLLTVYRDTWLRHGVAADLGIIRMIAPDPSVTMIGPSGGTAADSLGRVEVVIPPDALAIPTPIRITTFSSRRDFTVPLPDSTPLLYGMELEPSGIVFSRPVTVRLANYRSVPTSLPIPVGSYRPELGRWEHEAAAVWDAGVQRFIFQTDHFSPFDGNHAAGGGPGGGGGGGPLPNRPKPKEPEAEGSIGVRWE